MDDVKRVAFMGLYAMSLFGMMLTLSTCTATPDADGRARTFTMAGYVLASVGVGWVVAGLVGIAVHRAGQRRQMRRSGRP